MGLRMNLSLLGSIFDQGIFLLISALVIGMGKGPKMTLELVIYRLESRPLTDPCPWSLCLDLEVLTQGPGSTKSFHAIIETNNDLTIDFQQ